VTSVYANETPVLLYENARVVMHLIPLNSFQPAKSYDLENESVQRITPICFMPGSIRYNLDGLMANCPDRGGQSHSYTQIYRNGIIEAVDSLLLKPYDQKLHIPSVSFEEELILSLKEYLAILKVIGVELPILLFLTLLGVKGYSMVTSNWMPIRHETNTIDRDILFLPQTLIESFEASPEALLKPIFDSVWNACGFPRSLNYDEKGKWVGR
jgi:hypothetical protein